MTLLQPRLHFCPRLGCRWISPVLALSTIQFFALSRTEGNLIRAGGNAVPDFSYESKALFDAELKDVIDRYFHDPILNQPQGLSNTSFIGITDRA